jgi:hypothetical protein
MSRYRFFGLEHDERLVVILGLLEGPGCHGVGGMEARMASKGLVAWP